MLVLNFLSLKTPSEPAKRNPLAILVLPRLMGYRLDGSEEDFRALVHLGIVVAFILLLLLQL